MCCRSRRSGCRGGRRAARRAARACPRRRPSCCSGYRRSALADAGRWRRCHAGERGLERGRRESANAEADPDDRFDARGGVDPAVDLDAGSSAGWRSSRTMSRAARGRLPVADSMRQSARPDRDPGCRVATRADCPVHSVAGRSGRRGAIAPAIVGRPAIRRRELAPDRPDRCGRPSGIRREAGVRRVAPLGPAGIVPSPGWPDGDGDGCPGFPGAIRAPPPIADAPDPESAGSRGRPIHPRGRPTGHRRACRSTARNRPGPVRGSAEDRHSRRPSPLSFPRPERAASACAGDRAMGRSPCRSRCPVPGGDRRRVRRRLAPP